MKSVYRAILIKTAGNCSILCILLLMVGCVSPRRAWKDRVYAGKKGWTRTEIIARRGAPDYEMAAKDFIGSLSCRPQPQRFTVADVCATHCYRDYVLCWAWMFYANRDGVPVKPYDSETWQRTLTGPTMTVLLYDESLHFGLREFAEWTCSVAVLDGNVVEFCFYLPWHPDLFESPLRKRPTRRRCPTRRAKLRIGWRVTRGKTSVAW